MVIHKPSANYISGRERQRQHDSFKIKETAHFNSGHVLSKGLGSHVVAMTQENVLDMYNKLSLVSCL